MGFDGPASWGSLALHVCSVYTIFSFLIFVFLNIILRDLQDTLLQQYISVGYKLLVKLLVLLKVVHQEFVLFAKSKNSGVSFFLNDRMQYKVTLFVVKWALILNVL